MSQERLTIGFVRRGYSASGGAEAYLKRLGRGIVDAGHSVQLFATNNWPRNEWPFGAITRLRSGSTIAFADEVEQLRPQVRCDIWMSLERVWRCDVYRAGDGVHRAWLERREKFATRLQKFFQRLNRKHIDILRLEKSLLADRGAGRVIVNSQLVKNEIVDLYRYPADKIDIVRNGVPLEQFRFDGKVPGPPGAFARGRSRRSTKVQIGARSVSRRSCRSSPGLRGRGHFHFAHDLRSIFKCMSGSAR